MDIILAEKDIHALKSGENFSALSGYINGLIVAHFEELITLLYRLDINEKKLRDLLQQHTSEDAAPIIATLILERQEQKIRSRQSFTQKDNIAEEDKW